MSYNRLQRKQFGALVLLLAGFFVLYGGIKLYRSHPVCGTVLLILAGVWLLRRLVRFVRALSDDPYTRTTPYRKIELPDSVLEEPKNLEDPLPKEDRKDEPNP